MSAYEIHCESTEYYYFFNSHKKLMFPIRGSFKIKTIFMPGITDFMSNKMGPLLWTHCQHFPFEHAVHNSSQNHASEDDNYPSRIWSLSH